MYKCNWYWRNQCLANDNARNNATGTMACSKSAANALGLYKQDNTNSMCCCVEQISIPLANNAENEITEIMTCSKSTTN